MLKGMRLPKCLVFVAAVARETAMSSHIYNMVCLYAAVGIRVYCVHTAEQPTDDFVRKQEQQCAKAQRVKKQQQTSRY